MYELMIENARTDGFFKPGTFLIVQFPLIVAQTPAAGGNTGQLGSMHHAH